jgi:D-amino-acid dehydrogenase
LSRIGALKLIYDEDELSTPPGSKTSKEPVVLLRAQGRIALQSGMLCILPKRRSDQPILWPLVSLSSDALELEPSLGAMRPPSDKRLQGAALEPTSCHASCAAFARGLHRRAAATGLLFTVTGVRVSHMGAAEEADTGRKITGLTLDNGRHLDVPAGCAVVVAAGSWTPLLLRQLGLLVPVYPLKGHSLLVNLTEEEASAVPSRIVIEPDSNLFFSRHGQQFRVAAFGQFAGWDTQPDPKLVAQLRRASANVWPALAHHFEHAHAVSGLRPFVADGALLLGRDETYRWGVYT